MDEINETIGRLKIIRKQLEDAHKVITRDLHDCCNELCLRCGNYREKHLGACDGCRWRTDNG